MTPSPPRRPNQPPPTWDALEWAAVGPRGADGLATLRAELEHARMELRLGHRHEARGRLLRMRKALAKASEPPGGRIAETLIIRAVADALLAIADEPSPAAEWARAAAQFDRARGAGAELDPEEWGDYALSLTRTRRFGDLAAMLADGVQMTEDPTTLIAVADELAEGERLDEALTVIDAVVAAYGGHDGAQATRGRILAAMGRGDEAAKAFDIAAFGHGLREDYEGALQLVDEALALRPGDPDLLATRGRALVALGRLDEGIEALRVAVRLRPDASTVVALALALDETGDDKQALAELDRALPLGDDSAVAHAARAKLLYRAGMLEEAVRPLEDAIAAEPNDALLRALLADVYLQLKRPERALEEANGAIEQDPALAHAQAIAARALRFLGRFDAAVEHASCAVSLEPEPSYLAELGECLRRAGRLEEARDALERALSADPRHEWALGTLGQVLTQLGRYDESVDALTRAAELNPRAGWIVESLADVLLAVGRFERVGEVVAAALESAGETESAARAGLLGRQGEALRNLGRLEDARAVLAKALALNADEPYALGTMGQVLLGLDLTADAVASLRDASEHAPDTAWIAGELVAALIRDGQLTEAADEVASAEARGIDRDLLFDGGRALTAEDPELRAALDAAMERHPVSAVLLLLRAEARTREGAAAAAIGDIDAALANARRWPLAQLTRATLLRLEERDDEAEQGLRALIEEEPDLPGPRLELARMLMIGGSSAEAESLLRLLVDEQEHRDAVILLAELLTTTGRGREGLQLLGTVAERVPDPELLHRASDLADALGEPAAALDYAGRAARLAPGDAELQALEGALLIEARAPLEALRAFERACDAAPRNREGMTGRAYVLCELDLHGDALPIALQVAERFPGDVYVLAIVGVAHYMLGNGEAAVTALQEASGLASGNYWYRRGVGDALFLAGRPDQGRRWFREMLGTLEETPADTPREQHSFIAWCLYRIGEHGAALNQMSRALALDRRDATAQLDLALMTVTGGAPFSRAAAEYGRGIELAIHHEGLAGASTLHAALVDLHEALAQDPRLREPPETEAILRKLETKLARARADVAEALGGLPRPDAVAAAEPTPSEAA